MTNIGSGSGTSDQNMELWDPSTAVETEKSNGTTSTSTTQPTSFQDTVSFLSGLGKTAPDYVYGVGSPHLPHSEVQSDSFQWTTLSQDIAKHLQNKTAKPSQDQKMKDLIDQAISKLFSEDSDKLMSKFGGMTQEQVDAKLKYAVFHPDTNNPSDPVQQMAKVLTEQLQETMKGDAAKETQDFDQQVQQSYTNSFSLLLEEKDVPFKDKQAIAYAFFNSEAQAALTPAQKKLFDALTMQSMQKISTVYGVPATDIPTVDKENAFNIRLNIGYGDKYIETLKAMKADGKISDAEFKTLRAHLYYPDSIPIDEKMKGIEDKLQQDVFAAFVQENGLPTTFKPTVPTNTFDAWGNGLYRDTFGSLVENYKPAIDGATQKKLLAAMADPKHVPKDIQELFSEISKKAINTTIKTIGLPAAWKPDHPQINPNLDPKTANTLNGAKMYLNEIHALQQQMMEKMAESDSGGVKNATYMSYLAVIGKALDDMQQLIYAIQSSDAKVSKLLNSITLDMQLNKIDKMNKEAEERKEAERAGKSGIKGLINDLGKILGPVMSIVMVIAAIALSMIPPLQALTPMFIAIATGALVNSVSKAAGYDMMKKGFEAIDNLIASMIPESGLRDACQIIVKAFIIAYILITCLTSGPGGLVLAMQLGMDMMMSSNIIGETVKACGGDEQAQMIVTMIVMITVMVAIMVVMIAVAAVFAVLMAPAAPVAGAALAAEGAAVAAEGTAAGAAGTAASTTLAAEELVAAADAALITAEMAAQAAADATEVAAGAAAELMQAVAEGGSQAVIEAAQVASEVAAQAAADAAQWASETAQTARVASNAAEVALDAAEAAQAVAEGAATGVDTTSNVLASTGSAAQRAMTTMAEKSKDLLNFAKNWFGGFKDPKIFFQRTTALAQAGQTVAQEGFKGVQAGSNMVLNLELADLAIKIANLKADQEEIGGMIKQLKKCMEALLGELGGLSEFVKSINELQVKKFKDADINFVG